MCPGIHAGHSLRIVSRREARDQAQALAALGPGVCETAQGYRRRSTGRQPIGGDGTYHSLQPMPSGMTSRIKVGRGASQRRQVSQGDRTILASMPSVAACGLLLGG